MFGGLQPCQTWMPECPSSEESLHMLLSCALSVAKKARNRQLMCIFSAVTLHMGLVPFHGRLRFSARFVRCDMAFTMSQRSKKAFQVTEGFPPQTPSSFTSPSRPPRPGWLNDSAHQPR